MASDYESEDCGFDPHRGQLIFAFHPSHLLPEELACGLIMLCKVSDPKCPFIEHRAEFIWTTGSHKVEK